MTLGRKLLWGSLGWVTLGPIGAILGYAYAQMTEMIRTTQGDQDKLMDRPDFLEPERVILLFHYWFFSPRS